MKYTEYDNKIRHTYTYVYMYIYIYVYIYAQQPDGPDRMLSADVAAERADELSYRYS